MPGYDPSIDWVEWAYHHRVLEDGVAYSQVREPWQIPIDQALTTRQYVYLCTPRGHSKTDTIVFWLLVLIASTSSIQGIAAGADHDNAKLYLKSAEKLISLHPQLFAGLQVMKTSIQAPNGSYVDVISSDAGSAFGHNVNLFVMGDLHSWKGENGEKFFSALISTIYKRPHARCWIESNAMVLTSDNATWHKPFRDFVEANPEWYYWKAPGYLAGWSRDKVLKLSAFLNPLAYAQLINNEDVSGSESFLTREQIEAIEVLERITPPFPSRDKREGLVVVTADLGHVHDATTVSALQALPVPRGASPKLRLLRLDALVGSHKKPVQGADIEQRIRSFCAAYHPHRVLVDKYQAKHMVQANYGWEEITFSQSYNKAITEALYSSITTRQLSIYPSAGQGIHIDEHSGRRDSWDLRRELLSAIIKTDRSGYFRMDHQKDGFNDRMTAVAMGVHALMEEQHSPLLREEKRVEEQVKPLFSASALIEKWSKPKIEGEWREDFRSDT